MIHFTIIAVFFSVISATDQVSGNSTQPQQVSHPAWTPSSLTTMLFSHPGLSISCLLLLIFLVFYLWKGSLYLVNSGQEEEVTVLMKPKGDEAAHQKAAMPLRRYGTFRELPYHNA